MFEYKSKTLEHLTSWSHISIRMWYALAIALIILYILIFKAWTALCGKSKLIDKISNLCMLPCKDRCPPKYLRGDRYSLKPNSSPDCVMTIWELSHFIMHVFIGYFYNIQTSLLVGTGFELWEWYYYDCASFIDIFLNTLGAVIGANIWTWHQRNKKLE